MCVICYIPKGVKTPSVNVLRAMHEANPHGMGFCTPTLYHKGLSFDYFLQKIAKRSINEPCIIHFRYATHGSVKRANCHPFKQGDVYFAHNGILSIEPYKDTTDSETAFVRFLYPVIHRFGFDSVMLDRQVKHIIGGSKFAFMQGDKVRLFGNFIHWHGYFVSNLRFVYRLHS